MVKCYLAARVRVKPVNHSPDLGLSNNAIWVSDPGVLVGSGFIF